MAAFLPPTNLQKQILKEIVRDQGYGEGTLRIYERLKRELGDKTHPALDDDGNVALNQDDDILEFVGAPPRITSHKYTYNNIQYTYPTRTVTRQGVSKVERRKLLPTRRAIQDFYRKDEMVQIDRPVRSANAGGKRNPKKTGLKPIIPPAQPLSIVMVDAMRMPATVHNGKQYSWVFVAIDCLTRITFIEALHLNTQLSTTLKTKQSTDDDDDSKRPASSQVWKHFLDFLNKVNATREEHAQRTGSAFKEIHPRLVVSDRGSENSLFQTRLKELAEKHKGFYRYSAVPFSRSNYNSMAEIAVKIVRRYFYTVNRAFQEHLEMAKKQGKVGKTFKPPDWHTSQSTRLYDWVRDIELVQERLNSRYDTTIKCSPIEALLELNGNTHKIVAGRIKKRRDKEWAGVEHNLRLPGFSPSTPPVVGDYVRLKFYKNEMNLRFPQLSETRKGKKVTGKSASNNWSTAIFKITKLRILSKGQRTYNVKNIDPTAYKPNGFLNRTEIMKVSPQTQLSTGRTILEEDAYLNRDESEDEEDEEDEVETTKRKTRSDKEKEIRRLLAFSGKDWTKLLKNKQFDDQDGTLSEVESVEYRRFGNLWVLMYKDDEGRWEMPFSDFLSLASGEDWFQPEYDEYRKRKFK